MSKINFRLYCDQIYGLYNSYLKDYINLDIEKESFTTMFKTGILNYDNIETKQEISLYRKKIKK